jgi:hypothetical protein
MPDHIIRETFSVRRKGLVETTTYYNITSEGEWWNGSRRARQIAQRHFVKKVHFMEIPSYGTHGTSTTSGRKPVFKIKR